MNDNRPPAATDAPPGAQGDAWQSAPARGSSVASASGERVVESDPPDEPSEREILEQLEASVSALQEAFAAHEQSTAELRAQLRQVQQAIAASPAPPGLSAWQRWRESRRGLGASLTLTGAVAIVGGVLLHFALLHRWMDTTFRLGYLVGLTGVVLLLLGLLIVF